MKRPLFRTLGAALALILGCSVSGAHSQEWRDYVPVLPKVRERMLPVDPAKGYLVKEIKPDVYVITDGAYQSMFVTTGEGVILFDAPPSFAQHIQEAVAGVTREPIRKLVYSHAHVDHIAGAGRLKELPGLEIVAEKGVADFLTEMKDPRRPAPTTVFERETRLKLGTATILLKRKDYHSNEGDLFIYLPEKKVMMAIDTLAPGYVPFMNFDLTADMHQYLKMFDELLAYDFDVLVTGHLTSLGNRQDVLETKEYTMDVYETMKRIHNSADQGKMAQETVRRAGADNKFLIFQRIIDPLVDQAYQEIKARWVDRLAAVDIYGRSHALTMLIYVRWDDKL